MLSTRLAPLVAAVALLAAACSSSGDTATSAPTTTAAPTTTTAPPTTTTTTSPPPTTTTAPPTTTTTTTVPVDDDYPWVAGDCFDFGSIVELDELPYAPFGDRDRVDCREPHTYEVYFAGEVDEGPDDPYPGDDLGERISGTCTEAFVGYVGVVPSLSLLDTILYLPDAEEWAAGQRYQACILYQAGAFGVAEELERSVRGGDGFAWEPETGDCFGGDIRSLRATGPLACEEVHTFEVVGIAVHPAATDEPYPGEDELGGFIDGTCADALAAYAEGAIAGREIRVGVLPFAPSEWDHGLREFPCLAFVRGRPGELFEVQGSFAGEWRVIGVFGGDTVTT